MLELTETPPSNVFLPKEILKEIKKEGKVWYAHCDKYNFTSKYEIEKNGVPVSSDFTGTIVCYQKTEHITYSYTKYSVIRIKDGLVHNENSYAIFEMQTSSGYYDSKLCNRYYYLKGTEYSKPNWQKALKKVDQLEANAKAARIHFEGYFNVGEEFAAFASNGKILYFRLGEELHFQNEELLNHHKHSMLNSLKRQMNITNENEKERLFFHTISELEELFASNIHFYLTATSKG